MCYAAPAGAVLCMELVNPSPVDVMSEGGTVAGETYSRSSIIQQLSMLVGFLNSLDISEPDSLITSSARTVLKKVLDFLLNDTGRPQALVEPTSFNFTMSWDHFAQFNSLDDLSWLSQDWNTEDSMQ